MAPTLTSLLDLSYPLVQAPMAGVSTPDLAGAVARAGALGSIAVGAMSPPAADQAIREALRATGGLLNVNVFTHARPRVDVAREAAWLERLRPLFAAFGSEPPATLREPYRTLDDEPALLDVLLSLRPPVVSLHFGLPETSTLARLRHAGITVFATATSVAEARQLDDAGVDVIIAQGWEAGGHRGSFGPAGPPLGLWSLLPAVIAAVDRPVVAAGGLADGAGVARAMALGAAGAQLGTVFVTCPESAASEAHRTALRQPDRRTAMTRVFSGRPARALVNRMVRELERFDGEVPDYPRAYHAGKALAAAAAGTADYAPLWAGASQPRPDPLPAEELVAALVKEQTP